MLSQLLAPARRVCATALRLTLVPRLVAGVEIIWVFLLVLVGWVFFRAQSLADAWHVLNHSLDLNAFHIQDLFGLGLPRFEMAVACLMIVVVLTVDWLLAQRPAAVVALWQNRAFRWTCLAGGFYGVVFFGVFDKVQFIYFQF